MTISTTRSRIRTIGSATLAAGVALGMGALTLVAASPASAAPINKNINYTCVLFGDVNLDGSQDLGPTGLGPYTIPVNTVTTAPDGVLPGETIPVTPVQINIDLSQVADAARLTFGPRVKGGSTNTQVHFGINGEDTAVTLQNLNAPWMTVPDTNPAGGEPAGAWVVPVAGTVPAVAIPATATGTITIDAPSAFRIDAQHNKNDANPEEVTGISWVECSEMPGTDLALGSINVTGTAGSIATTLTGTAAPSAINEPAKVALSVTPATGTGSVTLSYLGKAVATAPVAGGKASIEVPAATLPEPGTFSLQARYTGDRTHLRSTANVSVVRTLVAVEAEKATAKIKAQAKPKKFKVNKKAKLKIAIKSDSDDLKGKILVKAGKKTIGKGRVNASGKGTIKLKKIKAKYVKKGKIKLKVTYSGNEGTEKAKKTVKVKVKR